MIICDYCKDEIPTNLRQPVLIPTGQNPDTVERYVTIDGLDFHSSCYNQALKQVTNRENNSQP